jgi:hypothetical protein
MKIRLTSTLEQGDFNQRDFNRAAEEKWKYSNSVADATHRPAKYTRLGKSVLTATKRDPGQFTLPGFYRLLPQLVGSCDPGGAGLGDRAPPGLAHWSSSILTVHFCANLSNFASHRREGVGKWLQCYQPLVVRCMSACWSCPAIT